MPCVTVIASNPLTPFTRKACQLGRIAKNIPARQIHVLLVEDHEPTRTILAQLLLRRSYEVTSAGSLTEARSLVEKHKKNFNLLISDIGLPDGSGYDLMRELRKNSDLKGIALTGYGMEQDVNRSHAAGFTTHLTKREDLAAYNEEYGRYFPANKPARTTVEVMLNSPELLVEITVTACIPD